LFSVERDDPIQRARISAEQATPNGIAQHDRIIVACVEFFGCKTTAKARFNSEHRKKSSVTPEPFNAIAGPRPVRIQTPSP